MVENTSPPCKFDENKIMSHSEINCLTIFYLCPLLMIHIWIEYCMPQKKWAQVNVVLSSKHCWRRIEHQNDLTDTILSYWLPRMWVCFWWDSFVVVIGDKFYNNSMFFISSYLCTARSCINYNSGGLIGLQSPLPTLVLEAVTYFDIRSTVPGRIPL